MKIKIAPSILSADFSNLARDIKKAEKAGADLLHVDVMDGHFVPNITIGPAVVKDIRKSTKLPLDVHLMIENPEKYAGAFAQAGSDMITVHVETISAPKIKNLSLKLRKMGVKLGVSLNPKTSLKPIIDVLKFADFVLVMSVNPGFGGQAFIPQVLPKIRQLRTRFRGDIAVDGGINHDTAKLVIAAGANVLAAGSYIFKSKDYKQSIRRLRCAK
ncbi:MAG: ribulose-phosphate 3-epimerase [Candidatus Omnitrophica bacterium]|jgi:ribulose-phosphate 3-epimerase|nr:ribulose-phosphate 3-epimerase [Candidatus Omnitrophota bacterium]MDD5080287.1 ribulose-phosphate 3-epimerase [Candidatus Omnitrophota bacterium]